MFGDMMGKLKDAQIKIEETKKRLDTILVDESSVDNAIKVTITANKVIKNIVITDELIQDKEQLEDYLVLTLNRAIEKATQISETELAKAAKDGMPNIPGLDFFK